MATVGMIECRPFALQRFLQAADRIYHRLGNDEYPVKLAQ